jgi:hypothetical protein
MKVYEGVPVKLYIYTHTAEMVYKQGILDLGTRLKRAVGLTFWQLHSSDPLDISWQGCKTILDVESEADDY